MEIYFSTRVCTLLIDYLVNFTGTEVLCPVNVCHTVPLSISLSRCVPRFYDVDPVSGMGTIDTIRARVTPRCRVIVFVFMYGNVIDIEPIREYAIANHMQLVLDYAGCFITAENLPQLNDNEICLLSFGYSKQLELGYGGALLQNQENMALIDKKSRVISLDEYLDAYKIYAEYSKEHYELDVNNIRESIMADAFLAVLSSEHVQAVKNFFYSDHKEAKEHKSRIDDIYAENIRQSEHIIFYPHSGQWPRWRFNILSDKRNLLLAKIFANKYFASKWFPPINGRFADRGDYPGAQQHAAKILNLFNDKRVSVDDANKISEIINSVGFA